MSAASTASRSQVGSRLVAIRRRRIKKRFNARLTVGQRGTGDRPVQGRPGGRPPDQTPCQVTRHVLELDDGQRVGVAVAGAGVPFVLLHGIGFHNRTYERCLSYLPELGFLAVAIEAPGHGDSSPVSRGADFAARVDPIRRAMDALGIRRAVMAGHSMGGRSAACFTALNPRRVLAAVFIDAALGENWDNALIKRLGSEVAVVRGLVDGIVDAAGETRNITLPERLAYYRMLSGPGRPRLADLARTPDVARAIAVAESDQWLAAIRAAAVPVVVLHGARDLVVPLSDARAVASRLDAPLLTVPDGYHSWLLASPRTFAAAMAGTFADGMPSRATRAGACVDPDALVLRWSAQPTRALPPRPDETVLDWRIERLSGTDRRRRSAKAGDRAADWAADSRRWAAGAEPPVRRPR
jgi:pimeloyl-ACP methyl ester carboxylesterase